MWNWQVIEDRILIGERFKVSFQRTLRIPDDGKVYPLPPTLGLFPVKRVSDYRDNLPKNWHGEAVFMPMYQREAMWLAFEAPSWKPCVVKVGLGGINALTGGTWVKHLNAEPQDYLVCPEQPWLDGVKTTKGAVRQFVAMPLGEGYSLEGQLTGVEESGGIQLLVYDPMPGIFPDEAPPAPAIDYRDTLSFQAAPGMEMGLGAGGQIQQKVYPDQYGLETWDQSTYGELSIFVLNSALYLQVTGEEPPPTPIDAQTYSRYGFPWFNLYDEEFGDLSATDEIAAIKSISEIDADRGLLGASEDETVEIDSSQVRKIRLDQQSETRRKPNE